MKQLFICAMFCFGLGSVQADIPWQTIYSGSSYWVEVFGLPATGEQPIIQKTTSPTVSTFTEPSIQLLNAVLRHHIDELPNKAMVNFADSMMHVLTYMSGANPVSKSNDNRAGWWMLPYPVALRYGLEVSEEKDERLDFNRATEVALQYSKELHAQFGSDKWLFAFMRSPAEATRALGNKQNQQLQRELKDLYQVMVRSSYTTAEEYAVKHFYSAVEEYSLKEQVLTDLILEKTGIHASTFQALNPAYCNGIIPAKSEVFLTDLALQNLKENEEDIVLLSQARLEDNEQNLLATRDRILKNQPDPRTSNTAYYKVRGGDNLGSIAERYGVRISDIKSWNNLRGNMIYVGQKLVVYNTKKRMPLTSNSTTKTTGKKPAIKPATPVNTGEFVTYKVKSGDTLYSIAQRFPGVSADNLMAWNGISANIKIGQQIKVLKSEIRDYNSDKYPDNF